MFPLIFLFSFHKICVNFTSLKVIISFFHKSGFVIHPSRFNQKPKMLLLPHDDNADPSSSYDYNHDDADDDGGEEEEEEDEEDFWTVLQHIGHHQTGLINVSILNKVIHICQGWDEKEKVAEAALEVFHKFEVFQCVPN